MTPAARRVLVPVLLLLIAGALLADVAAVARGESVAAPAVGDLAVTSTARTLAPRDLVRPAAATPSDRVENHKSPYAQALELRRQIKAERARAVRHADRLGITRPRKARLSWRVVQLRVELAYWRAVLSTLEDARITAWTLRRVEALIRRVFGPTADAAIAVARCESGLSPDAYNPSGATGIFQVMTPLHGPRWLYAQAEPNVRFAYRLSRGGTDWTHWVCKP